MTSSVKISRNEPCPECIAEPGMYHESGCEEEQCPYCGGCLADCPCKDEPPLHDRLPWIGEYPGKAECREWGWYARRLPGRGWVPRPKDDPGAVEDLDRFHAEARWDRDTKR